MNGTEWTNLGEGATVGQLADAYNRAKDFGEGSRVATHLYLLRDQKDWKGRTNLKLTGRPLTAEDVNRIGMAE